MINTILPFLGTELAYTSGCLAGSILLSFILLWVFAGLAPRKVLYEIEHNDNAAVGLVSAGFSLISSLAVGYAFSDPQTQGTLQEGFFWLLGGLLLASVYYGLVAYLVLWLFSRNNEPKESPRAFLKREIQVDKNAGLVSWLIGLAFSCYIPVILITIK
jgi:hypothetical protein